VIEDLQPPVPPRPEGAVPAPGAADAAPGPMPSRAWWVGLAVVGALTIASLVLAWKADQRAASFEPEMVRRQQESAARSAEANAFAKQAQETATETGAKVALLEARLAEVSVQRGQLEELMQSMSRSRDENLLVDLDAAIRVAMQQAAITGSAEPLVATLKQSDERLARRNQPRLEGVRRAITRDLERVKATSVTDIASLGIRLDEAVRMVDELPMLATAERAAKDAVRAPVGKAAGGAANDPASGAAGWGSRFAEAWSDFAARVWGEARSLVRVTRIEHPESMFVAPEQSFFLRENLKLRLLNARLALLSRQFDTAQADLLAAQSALERYFDRNSRRTALTIELIRQVAGQGRQVTVPRPEDTLAALAALTATAAGR
jgi:uroporphyrin-III C-methyltransferase